MLRDGLSTDESDGWASTSAAVRDRRARDHVAKRGPDVVAKCEAAPESECDAARDVVDSNCEAPRQKRWQYVDGQLRGIARQYLALDAELARWLREAERIQVWRHFGCATMLEYLERIFGYSPRQGRERLMVSRRLGGLPELEGALERGELPYSAVRELSRIATRTTESAWIEEARGRCLREIEDLVTQREVGDLPQDPPRPDRAPMRIAFDVLPETYALFRQVWKMLETERGEALTDDGLIAAMLDAVVAPPDAETRKGRAKFQIAVTTCARCKQSTQHGGGKCFALDDTARERAECDAQHIGSIDTDEPARASQNVPPRVRRLLAHRDGYRCRAPGCRSARFLEVHHIIRKADGGTNKPSNLILLCDAHHKAHHEGAITISGTAPHDVRFHRGSAWTAGGGRSPMVDGDPLHPGVDGGGAVTDGDPHVVGDGALPSDDPRGSLRSIREE